MSDTASVLLHLLLMGGIAMLAFLRKCNTNAAGSLIGATVYMAGGVAASRRAGSAFRTRVGVALHRAITGGTGRLVSPVREANWETGICVAGLQRQESSY